MYTQIGAGVAWILQGLLQVQATPFLNALSHGSVIDDSLFAILLIVATQVCVRVSICVSL